MRRTDTVNVLSAPWSHGTAIAVMNDMKRLLSLLCLLAACASGSAQTSLTTVELEMNETPPPSSLAHSHTTYVAWADPQEPDEPMMKLGALSYDYDTETATFDATVARSQYDIVVTSEPNARVLLPSGIEVLRARCDFDGEGTPCEVLQ